VIALMAYAFVDISAWFAYVNRLDRPYTHPQFVSDVSGRLVTSNFIFDETVTLCPVLAEVSGSRHGWRDTP
jgi:hypothetical protein